jgi:putative transposase
MAELKHYRHGISQNTHHLQWCTKYRDTRFQSTYRRKICEGAINLAAVRHGIRIVVLRVLPDHVHAFVELKPSMAPTKALNLLKGISSRILRRNIKHLAQEKCLWSPGNFSRSVGSVTSEVIEHYIAFSSRNQRRSQNTLGNWV